MLFSDKSMKDSKPHELATDWYLPAETPLNGYVFPGPQLIKSDKDLMDTAVLLAEKANQKHTEEFLLRHDKLVFRGHKIESVDGLVFSLRRVPAYVPNLEEIGLDRAVQSLLLHRKLGAGGLVIVSGETGQGKSTSAAAFLKARMEKFGSFCLTIEDPPEMPLNGQVGKSGICIQTDVRTGTFGDALRGAVRCYPTQGNSLLFVGETRDPETAGEVLRIATNGHLVLTTIHGADIISSMKRFMALAMSYKNMTEAEAKSVFSSAFKMIMHQRLKDMPDGNKKLEVKLLLSGDHASPVANRIRSGTLDSLSTDIQQQGLMLAQGQVEKLMLMFDTAGNTSGVSGGGLSGGLGGAGASAGGLSGLASLSGLDGIQSLSKKTKE